MSLWVSLWVSLLGVTAGVSVGFPVGVPVGVTAGVRSDWMVVAGVLVFALVALIVFIRSAILLVRLARTISSA